MIRFFADHCFDEDILRGVKRRLATFDCLLARDVGLDRAPDILIITWAAREDRVVLTLDRNTMTRAAKDHICAGGSMAGLVVVRKRGSFVAIIEDIILIAQCADPIDLQGRTVFIPF